MEMRYRHLQNVAACSQSNYSLWMEQPFVAHLDRQVVGSSVDGTRR